MIRNRRRGILKLASIGLALAWVLAGPVHAPAAPIIDGIVTDADGYDVLFPISFQIKPKTNAPAGTPNLQVPGGALYVYRDLATPGSDIYIALSVPTNLSDNIYGWAANKNNPDSEWLGRSHNYGDLVGDTSIYSFYDSTGTAVVTDWTFTLFGQTKPAPTDPFIVDWNTSLNYNVNNFDVAAYNSTLPAGDPYIISDILQDSPKPGTAGWTDNLIYEFQFDGSYFGSAGFGLVFADSHNSPNKMQEIYADAGGDTKLYNWNTAYGPEDSGGTPIIWDYDPSGPYGINAVPEPSVYVLLASSLLIIWLFRRRRAKMAPAGA